MPARPSLRRPSLPILDAEERTHPRRTRPQALKQGRRSPIPNSSDPQLRRIEAPTVLQTPGVSRSRVYPG
jgi:hypothetical protein